MAPRKSLISRRKNLEKARENTKENTQKIFFRFVLSVLASGLTFSKIYQYKKMNREPIVIDNAAKFYLYQKIITPYIIMACRRNIYKYQKQMKDNTIISFDGSWDHRRDGKFCIVEVIDTSNKKIIDFEILSRKTQKNSEGNFDGPSNQMEIECIKKIVQRLKGNSKITGYVHDQDSKLTNYMSQNWNITEYIDPNHANKSFYNKYHSYNNGNFKNVKKGILKGILKSLSIYRNILIKSDFTPDEKVSLWKNVIEHYKGNHTFCNYSDFLKKVIHIIKMLLILEKKQKK